MNTLIFSRVIYAVIVLAAFGVYLLKGNGALFLQTVMISSVALLIIFQQVTIKKIDQLTVSNKAGNTELSPKSKHQNRGPR